MNDYPDRIFETRLAQEHEVEDAMWHLSNTALQRRNSFTLGDHYIIT